jgi:hypothetical protein
MYGQLKRRPRTPGKLSKLEQKSTEDGVRSRQQGSVQKHFSDNYKELVRQHAAASAASRKTESWIHTLMESGLETEVFGELQEFRSAALTANNLDEVSGYKLVEHRRQATASTKIQSLFRAKVAKRDVAETRIANDRISAAVVIATSARMKLARDKVRNQRRLNAAICIQRFLRGVMSVYKVNVKRTEAPDGIWDQLHGRKGFPPGVPIDSSYVFVPRVLRHSCLKKAAFVQGERLQQHGEAVEAEFVAKPRARRNSTALEDERGVKKAAAAAAASSGGKTKGEEEGDDLPIPCCKLQGAVMNIEVCGMMEAMRFYMMKANRDLGLNGSTSTLVVAQGGKKVRTWKDCAKHISTFLNKVMGVIMTVCEEYGGDVLSIKGAGPTLQVLWACTPPQHVYTPVSKQETRTKAVIQAVLCSRALVNRMNSVSIDDFLEPGAVPPLSLQMAIGCGVVNLVHVGGLCGRWDMVVQGQTVDNMLLADSVGFASGMCGDGDVVLESRAWTAIRDVAVGERLLMDSGKPGKRNSTSKSKVVRLISLANDVNSLANKKRTRTLPVPSTIAASDCVSLIRAYIPGAMHKILDARARKVQQLLVAMGETAETTVNPADAPPKDLFAGTDATPVIVTEDDEAESSLGPRNRSASLEDIGDAGVLANAITTSMSQSKQRQGERKRKTVIWKASQQGPNAAEINTRLSMEWEEMSKSTETSAEMDHMELYDVRTVSILSVRLYGAGASAIADSLAGPGGRVGKNGKLRGKGARKMSGSYSSWAFTVDCMKIRALSCHAQRAVYENEGSMSENRACYIPSGTNGEDGGNFIMLTFVFGLPPLCHTDDPARAVAAARLMISQLQQKQQQRKRELDLGLFRGESNDGSLADPDFGFAAAVVTGRTFYGVVGSQARQQLLLHGEQVHQANELCRLAKRGEILVDSTTAKLTKEIYTFGNVEEARGGDGLQNVKHYKSRHARARAMSGRQASKAGPSMVNTSRKQRGTVYAHPDLDIDEPLSPISPGHFLKKQRGTVYQHPEATTVRGSPVSSGSSVGFSPAFDVGNGSKSSGSPSQPSSRSSTRSVPTLTPANNKAHARGGMVKFSAEDDASQKGGGRGGGGGGMVRFSGGEVEKAEDTSSGVRMGKEKPRHTIRGAANIKLLGTMKVTGKVPQKKDDESSDTAGWLAQKKRAQLLQHDRANLRRTLESRTRSKTPAGPVTVIGTRGSGKVRMVQDIIAFGHENGFTLLTGSTKRTDEDVPDARGDEYAASDSASVSKTNNLELFWKDDTLQWMREMSEWTGTWIQIIEQCIQLMRLEKRRVDIFTLEAFLREQLLPPEMRDLWVLVRDVFNVKAFLQSEVDPLTLDKDKLEKLLKGHGIKVGSTAQDMQKLSGLCEQIQERKCTLVVTEDKSAAATIERLILSSDVITVIIRSQDRDRVLVELFEFPPDGQVIEKMSVLQSVLTTGQPWIEGAYLCVRRKLGVGFHQINVLEQTYVREVITSAQQLAQQKGGETAPGGGGTVMGAVGVSFAGLERQCVHHIVEVEVCGLPNTDRFVIAQTMEHEMSASSGTSKSAAAAKVGGVMEEPQSPLTVQQQHQRSQWAWFSKHALKDLPHVTAVLNYQHNYLEQEAAGDRGAGEEGKTRKGRRQSMMELGALDQETRNARRVAALSCMVKSFADKVGPVIMLMQLRIGTSVTGQPRMTDDSWSLVRKLTEFSMTKSRPGFMFVMVGRPEISTKEFRHVLKTSVSNGTCVRISCLDERERWEYLQNILDVFTIPPSLGAFMSRVAAGNPSDIELATKYLLRKGFVRVNKQRKCDMTSDIYETLKQHSDEIDSMIPDKLIRHVTGRFECLTHRHQAVVKMAAVQCAVSSSDMFRVSELIATFEVQQYMSAHEVRTARLCALRVALPLTSLPLSSLPLGMPSSAPTVTGRCV